mmetsp:Transcript_45746/g.106206  ORF Transcript_45746/g.106206 Transcript_45746/m.106206 type:complete len:602 (-) Transcript_45746:145-1950(-)
MPYGYKDRSDRHSGRGRARGGDSHSDASRGHKRRKDDKKSSKKETTGRSDRRDKRDHRRDERGDRKEDRGRGDRDAKRARIESTQGTLAEPPQNEVDSPVNEDMDESVGIQVEEDDEQVERLREEAKKRREALMKRWVEEGTEDTGLPTLARPSSADEQEQVEPSKPQEVDAKTLEEKMEVNRFILDVRKEDAGDMFGDEETADLDKLNNQNKPEVGGMYINGASGEDWDDSEGYYRPTVGEKMGARYLVVEANCGKGVFSNVVKASDTEDPSQGLVAIKIMRCNDMMRKAAEKEVEVLRRIGQADKGGRSHCIRLLDTFDYRKHLCLVFECMWDNLRVALKKYTQGKGMALRTVRSYAKQLLTALSHIHRCEYVHADIKPDNILISDSKEGRNIVKICDLGSAVQLTEVEMTAYLASRWYRSPEVMLGIKFSQPSDTWALGATLMEFFTGKPLFPGRTNNDMIRLIMEAKGKLPHKLITKGTLWKQHFNEQLDFKHLETDKVTKKEKVRVMTDCSAKRALQDMVLERVGLEKQKSSAAADQYMVKKAKQFANLLDLMTTLDPEKRPSPGDLLSHAFLAESWDEKAGSTSRKSEPASKLAS